MRRVAIFAPTPILTVTLEAGPDGEDELHVHAGGQGVWIARMLAGLGTRPLLCAPYGGETGAVLRDRLEAEGIGTEGVAAVASNGFYVHDRRTGNRVELASRQGQELGRHEADDLYDVALVEALDAGVAVLAGQLPPGVVPMETYRRLAHDLRANGCRVIADLSGEPLVRALEGGLDFLKVSHEEAVADGWARGRERDSLVEGLRRLHDAGARTVVMSRAEEPALVVSEGRFLEVVVPRLVPLDFRGSGDSMTAGLATAVSEGLSLEASLRLAAAAGSLNVTRRGLGTGPRREIERLAAHVQLREMS